MYSLKEYIQHEIRLLNAFHEYWKRNHKQCPEQYPVRLSTGDWDQQFLAFVEIGGEDSDSL